MPEPPGRAIPPGLIMAAIVGLVFLTLAAVVGLFVVDSDKSTPLITALLGFTGTIVTALLATLSAVRYMNGRVNHVDNKVENIADHVANRVDETIQEVKENHS